MTVQPQPAGRHLRRRQRQVAEPLLGAAAPDWTSCGAGFGMAAERTQKKKAEPTAAERRVTTGAMTQTTAADGGSCCAVAPTAGRLRTATETEVTSCVSDSHGTATLTLTLTGTSTETSTGAGGRTDVVVTPAAGSGALRLHQRVPPLAGAGGVAALVAEEAAAVSAATLAP